MSHINKIALVAFGAFMSVNVALAENKAKAGEESPEKNNGSSSLKDGFISS